MAKTKTKVENEVKEEIIEPEVVKNENVVEPVKEEVCTGTVIKCAMLNIRKKPVKDEKKSPAIDVIKVGSKVTIDKEASTNGWYKVATANGNIGFCMKEYIKID